MARKIFLIGEIFIAVFFLAAAVPASAQSAGGCNPADEAAGLCRSSSGGGYGGLVPCGSKSNPCDFGDLIVLIGNVIEFLIFLGAIVAGLIFAYAGFQYIFAAGDPHKIEHAHELFKDAGIGLVLMGIAWLVVALIVNVFGAQDTAGQFLEGLR